MFSSSGNQGFKLTFENGNTVSVQWGTANYCDPTHPKGRNAGWDAAMTCEGAWESTTAEVAAWNANGVWHNFGHDQVNGWQSMSDVLEFINFVANNELNVSSPFDDYDDDDDEAEDLEKLAETHAIHRQE